MKATLRDTSSALSQRNIDTNRLSSLPSDRSNDNVALSNRNKKKYMTETRRKVPIDFLTDAKFN